MPESVNSLLGLARTMLCLSHHRNHGTEPAKLPCEECPSCAQSRKLQHPNLRILFPLPTPKEGGEDASRETYTDAQQKQIDGVLAAKAEDAYSPLTVPGGQEILLPHIHALRQEFSSLQRLVGFGAGRHNDCRSLLGPTNRYGAYF